jgi:hypothetical protein
VPSPWQEGFALDEVLDRALACAALPAAGGPLLARRRCADRLRGRPERVVAALVALLRMAALAEGGGARANFVRIESFSAGGMIQVCIHRGPGRLQGAGITRGAHARAALALASEVAREHGGELAMVPRLPCGELIVLTLPRARLHGRPAPLAAPAALHEEGLA